MSRSWCFTLLNYTPHEEYAIQSYFSDSNRDARLRYVIYGRHITEDGERVLRGYIYRKHACTPRMMRKISCLLRASVGCATRHPFIEIDWCKHSSGFLSWGKVPAGKKIPSPWQCVDIDDAVQRVLAARSMRVLTEHERRHCAHRVRIVVDSQIKPHTESRFVAWIHGGDHSDRNRMALWFANAVSGGARIYSRFGARRYFDTYDYQRVALLLDVGSTSIINRMNHTTFTSILTRGATTVETYYCRRPWMAEVIVLTSPEHPDVVIPGITATLPAQTTRVINLDPEPPHVSEPVLAIEIAESPLKRSHVPAIDIVEPPLKRSRISEPDSESWLNFLDVSSPSD